MSELAIEELPAEWGVESAPSLVPAHIFASLICGCGRSKRHGCPLCNVCWDKAPVDLRSDAWKREPPERQIAALAELRRVLEHTHDPVKPGYVGTTRERTYPTVEARTSPVPEAPRTASTDIQAPPALPQRYIIRLTETQMDRFLTAASAEWKQSMVQMLLDAEGE